MKKKLITLAKELEFTTENEYFDYLINSHTNGNFDQCRELFKEMKRTDQKEFVLYINSNWANLQSCYNFYFQLL